MEQMIAMGKEEGITAALGQIDDLLREQQLARRGPLMHAG
jgi:hypothetical protein